MIRYATLIILLLPFSIFAQTNISFQANNKPLIEVFKQLEKEYELYFAYSTEQISEIEVSIDADNETLDSFLKRLLEPVGFSYELLEGKFVAIKSGASVVINLQLIDQESSEPLSFALAQIKGTQKGAIADQDGRFNSVWKGSSTDTIVFSFLGYEDLEVPIGQIESMGKKLGMTFANQKLGEYIVQEYINTGITSTSLNNGISITPDDLDVLPGLAERDVLLSAQQIAGVSSNDESAAGINIRGSSRANTFIYWNNIPIYHPAHYFGNISSFIPSTIGQVNVYKNFIPTEFGGSSAGLITMTSKVNENRKFTGEASLNLTHADLMLSTPVGEKSSLMFAARRSFNDFLATPTFNSLSEKLFEGSITQSVQEEINEDEDFQYNSKLAFTDFNVVWDLNPSDRSNIRFSALRSESVLDFNTIDDEELNESDQTHNITNLGGNITWNQNWSSSYSSQLSGSIARYNMEYQLFNFRDNDDGSDGDFQSRFNEFTNVEIRFTNNLELSDRHLLTFGAQYNFLDLNFSINEDFFFEEEYDEAIISSGNTFGAFAKSENRIGDKLESVLSARFNYFPILGEYVIDPQLRIQYALTDDLFLKTSLGKYHQYINTIQEPEFNFSNTIEQHWITADEDEGIPVLSNTQFVVGAYFEKKGWLVDLDLFQKRVDGILSRRIFSLELDEGLQIGNETILGLDLMIRKRWKYLRTWINYSHLDSEVEIPESELFGFSSNTSIRHQMQITQTATIKNLELSVGYTFRTGPFFTNAIGLDFINDPDGEDPDEFEPYYEIEYGPINEELLPNYHRIDLSAWYKLPKTKTRNFHTEFGLTILNVLNRTNVFTRSFRVEEFENENVGILESEKYLIGIAPNLSVRVRF